MKNMKRRLTPADVAEEFQVTERTVYEWLRSGELTGAKLGGMWRVDITDLENFMDRNRGQQLMETARKKFPDTEWVEGRCYECGRAIPVRAHARGMVCGRACLDAYRAKLYQFIDAGSEEDAGSFHPEIVPFWT